MPDALHSTPTGPRVLVVDDDRNMTRTLARILELKGYWALVAHSGTEALERLTERCCDCVVSDIRMPNTNGVDLCRQVRSKHPSLPILLMTAYAEEETIACALQEGAAEVITKPLDIDALLTRIDQLCARA